MYGDKRENTNLAIKRLVHMVHPSSLGEWLQGRKRQAFNLGVGHFEEVMLKCNINLLETFGPAIHADFIPDGGKMVQVRTGPAPKNVFEKCIL